MSKSFKLDNDNNLVFENQGLVIVEDDDSLAQDVKNRLLLYKGECFYNPDLGVLYHKDLHLFDKNSIIQLIKNQLNEEPRIKDYDIQIVSQESGTINIELKLTTKEGNIIYV